MIGWVTKRAVFEHLHKRIIQTANNNFGYVADAGVIISDLADRLQVWLNEMDIVDAVPVVHGKWIDTKDGGVCSMCKSGLKIYKKIRPLISFCPFCGARMDDNG